MTKSTSSVPTKRKKSPKKTPKWFTVNDEDVLIVDKNGRLLLFGEPISEIDAKNLKEEVKVLRHLRLWRIMQETVRHRAVDYGVVRAKTWEETLSAKMMLYVLDVLKNINVVIDRHIIK